MNKIHLMYITDKKRYNFNKKKENIEKEEALQFKKESKYNNKSIILFKYFNCYWK